MIKFFLQVLWSKITGKPINEELGFSCCFCNKSLMSLYPTPSEIIITARIYKPKEERVDQIFWCHMQCLKKKIHKNLKHLFVLDDVTKQKPLFVVDDVTKQKPR
jgi:hypothetical protein